jgi:uncharacterized metal-binding protein YceD (DUF177 family)
MGNPLQDLRTAAEFASVRQVIEINEKIGSFDKLSGIVEADLAALEADKIPPSWRDSIVCGELQFGFIVEADGIPTVTGSASTTVDAVCQRCLEPFRQALSIEPKLLLVGQQEAVDEFKGYEVWELQEEALRPQDIVEELLIMALPFSATHDNLADCKTFASDDDSATDLRRPFAALASQMKRNKKDLDE